MLFCPFFFCFLLAWSHGRRPLLPHGQRAPSETGSLERVYIATLPLEAVSSWARISASTPPSLAYVATALSSLGRDPVSLSFFFLLLSSAWPFLPRIVYQESVAINHDCIGFACTPGSR